MKKTRVLLLCTGNTARTHMTGSFLRHYAGQHFDVYSAGPNPDVIIHPHTHRVMDEIGFDLSGQYSKHVSEYMGEIHFGYCIIVCGIAEPRCPTTFPYVSQILRWPFDDPVALAGSEEDTLNKFREVRDQIDQRIKAWITENDG